jgi:hypothetical protein
MKPVRFSWKQLNLFLLVNPCHHYADPIALLSCHRGRSRMTFAIPYSQLSWLIDSYQIYFSISLLHFTAHRRRKALSFWHQKETKNAG